MRFASRSSPENFIEDSSPPIGEFREKDNINFTHGYANPPRLPEEQLSAASQRVLSEHKNIALQYGPSKGVSTLLESLLEYLASDFHISTNLDSLMITTGAKQGLDLLCKAFIEPGDKVAVTTPTYGTGLKILQTHEADYLTVPVDRHGLDVPALRAEIESIDANGGELPKLIYDVPEFHNPTGVTMSLNRRRELIDLVETYDVTFVEDAPHRKLWFECD
jgi:2-aminoadipate transaminase